MKIHRICWFWWLLVLLWSPAAVCRTPVREAEQLLHLLERDRADVVLYKRWQGLAQARQSQVAVRVMEPPLASVPMYMYLHVKRADLVPGAAAALAKLKRNGTYQRLFDETLRPLLKTGAGP